MGGAAPLLTGTLSPPHADDLSGALRDPAVVRRRRVMLDAPHMRPLNAYRARLAGQVRGFVPDFDPLDGGVGARLLFLLEKPGPKTFPPLGSGFVSRENADPTAMHCRAAMIQADIPREGTIIWNVVPWWNETIRYSSAEMRAGAAELAWLLALLPALRGVVQVGNNAAVYGGPVAAAAGLLLFRSVHPSNQARIGPASRDAWMRIPDVWGSAWKAVA